MSDSRNNKKGVEEEASPDSGFVSGDIRPSEDEISDLISPQQDARSSSSNLDSKNGSDEKHSSKYSDVETTTDSGVIEGTEDFSSEISPPVVPTIITSSITDKNLLDKLFAQDYYGDTHLHTAAAHDCQQTVSKLIKACQNKSWLNTQNRRMQTALHYAVLKCNFVIARMLVHAGASLAVRDYLGQTPLHIATTNKDINCLHALLFSQDTNKTVPASILNQKNYDGQACIHIATWTGQKDLVKCLIYYGCDIYIPEGHAGWTMLHIAVHNGYTELVQYIVEVHTKLCDVVDYAGRTPRNLVKRRHRQKMLILFANDDDDSDSSTDYDSDDDDAVIDILASRAGMLAVA